MGAAASSKYIESSDLESSVDLFIKERVENVVRQFPKDEANNGVTAPLQIITTSNSGKTSSEKSSDKVLKKRVPSKLRLKHQTSKEELVLAHSHSMSLRALALRHYSRQENVYIEHEVLSASFMEKKASANSLGGIGKDVSSSYFGGSADSSGSAPAGERSSSGQHVGMPHLNLTIDVTNGEAKRQPQRPNLKIQIHDDPDWVQVSDGEDDDVGVSLSPRVQPARTLTLMPAAQQSYLFTRSGTIFVDGFHKGIGTTGIFATSGKGTNNSGAMMGASTGQSGPSKEQSEGSSSVVSPAAARLAMRERLVVLCKLGAGASSIVYKAFDISDMQIVALKMVPVYDRAKRRQMVRELSALFMILKQKQEETLTSTSSSNDVNTAKDITSSSSGVSEMAMDAVDGFANIVRFFDAFSNLEDGGCALCMEYMDGGSLQDIADAGGVTDEDTLASIASQALEGLSFLHSCNFIHRDIKPGNILIDQAGRVKVSDLGILRKLDAVPVLSAKMSANVLDEISDGTEDAKEAEGERHKTYISGIPRAHTFVGTAVYMAPERIDGRDYTISSDIWSLGLTLLTVCMGKLPINQDGGYWGILHAIRDSPPPRVPRNDIFSDEFADFVACMLKTKPEERYTCDQLLEHQFLTSRRGQGSLVAPGKDLTDEEREALKDEGVNVADLSTEHYVAELQTILYGLYSHLEQLKRGAELGKVKNYEAGATGMTSTDTAGLPTPSESLLLQLVRREGPIGAMCFLLLGESDIRVVALDDTTQREHQYDTLKTLARQINLSPERTVLEIKQFLDGLARGVHHISDDEDEGEESEGMSPVRKLSSAPTPKAKHST